VIPGIARQTGNTGSTGCIQTYLDIQKRAGVAMIRTICASLFGALILIAALIPPAIHIFDRAGF